MTSNHRHGPPPVPLYFLDFKFGRVKCGESTEGILARSKVVGS